MSLIRRLVLVVLTLVIVAAFWVFWNRPTKVDLATYAPADAFAYLESNNPTEVIGALQDTDAWRTLAPLFHLRSSSRSPLLTSFARLTGLAPADLVVTSRAQVAIAVMNIGASEDAGNLKVKPDLAVIIETHTSSRRVKPLAEGLLGQLAKSTYGNPTFSRLQKGGTEFLIWTAPAEPREIVATVDDTVVVIGNSGEAIEACLAVRRGARPNLSTNVELQAMRGRLDSEHALAFGYVSSTNTGRLAAIATPLLVGSTDSGFQQILPAAAGKVLGSMGWTSRGTDGVIEDRYLFSLSKPVVAQLQAGFKPIVSDDQLIAQLLSHAASGTVYRFEQPPAAWQAFESAMLSQLDAVAAIVFKTLLKASFSTYGVEDAEEFVKLIGPEVATIHISDNSPRSTIIAGLPSPASHQAVVSLSLGPNIKRTVVASSEIFEAPGKEHVVAFQDSHVLIGPADDVRACLQLLSQNAANKRLPRATIDSAVVRSYSDDSQRVRGFFSAIVGAKNSPVNLDSGAVEAGISKLPMLITESAVTNEGIDRRTRSPLGQFGTLAALFFSQ